MMEDTIYKIRSFINELEDFGLDELSKGDLETRDEIIKKLNIALLRLQKLDLDKTENINEICNFVLEKSSRLIEDFKSGIIQEYIDDLFKEIGVAKDLIQNDELINRLIDESYQEVNRKYANDVFPNKSISTSNINNNQATKGLIDWLDIDGE